MTHYYFNRFQNIEDHAEVLAELGNENSYFVAKALEYMAEKCDYFILKTKNQSDLFIVEYQVGRMFRQESSKGLTTALARTIHSLDAIKRAVEAEGSDGESNTTGQGLLALKRKDS
jgi:hypothetical protein